MEIEIFFPLLVKCINGNQLIRNASAIEASERRMNNEGFSSRLAEQQ